jgi:regulator of protease activity HflC (stomatin/prohibitin superfamily)
MGGIVLLIFLGISVIITIIGIIVKDKFSDYTNVMWIIGACCTVIFIFFVWMLSVSIIDAGDIGVQVEFGRVKEKLLSQGWNTKSIFTNVVVYSIRLQEYTMSATSGEGDKTGNDTVMARTLDNSNVMIDSSMWYNVDPERAQDLYKKVAKSETEIKTKFIRPAIRTAMRDVAATFTLENLIKERDKYGQFVLDKVRETMAGKGVLIDRVLIRSIDPPKRIDDAIEAKLQAEQELQQKEFELEKTKKDAEIRREEAKGIADAQKIIQKELTPIYVQFEAIQAYRTLASSPNTTFVILPTDPKGAGMPLILNTK